MEISWVILNLGILGILVILFFKLHFHYQKTHFLVDIRFLIFLFFQICVVVSSLLIGAQDITYHVIWDYILLVLFRIAGMGTFVFIFTTFNRSNWNFLNIINLFFTCFVLGFFLNVLVSTNIRDFHESPYGILIYSLYFGVSGTILAIQLILFFLKSPGPKKMNFFSAILIFSAMIGVLLEPIVGWFILPLLHFFFVIGLSSIYILYPHSFFFSTGKISRIILFSTKSGMALVNYGDSRSLPEGFFSSLILQKEIFGSEGLPREIQFKNHEVAMIEQHALNQDQIIGIVFSNIPSVIFRNSLKFALRQFHFQFCKIYCEDPNHVGPLQEFDQTLESIFDYILL